ncbi:hypothetical protein PY650_34830 [Rhizobium calliandrae]|uniref:Primase C-terminal 1 domain-containing protein n=1 Tax=Rhizobium calliandrae TaxID=1312182 RepID=A0ABT7KPV8_9HYPH|nr:hypothetical protein [Rhizobium calliandrae]MDL2410656.1 hypothetical protein [Rhizobium calliandrae]
MTQEQERAFVAWQEEATAAKLRNADRRQKASARQLAASQSLPERVAAQTAMMAANGGRLPPRWRYEDATKKVRGETVEYLKRVANRPAYIPMMPYDPAIDGHGPQRAAERQDRIDNGFILREDIVLSGHLVQKGLRFEGFKSETLDTKSALRWPALVHRSRDIRVCWHRGSSSALKVQVAAARADGVPEWLLAEHGDAVEIVDAAQDVNMRVLEPAHFKVLGLDAPTVEGNKKLLGFIRLDTDLDWKSTEHLLRALREKVEARKIRSLPNFIVGIRTEDGRLIRPHLIWLLPIDMGVLNVDNKFLRKFKAVYYGLCRALADLGADPQAPATSQLVKNPLSPLYHTECPSDAWTSLDEHASCLDMGLDRTTLVREAVATLTGETFRHSNEYFNGCLDAARGLMARWLRDRDPFYVEAFANGDDGLLIDRLQEALSTLVVAEGMKPRSMEYVRHKVAAWVVGTWNPAKISGRSLPTPKRLAHIVGDVRGVAARQAVAGRYSAKVRADRTLERLIEAWNRLVVNGQPSKSALAKDAGLSRQTVINRYAELQAAVAAGGVKDALMLYRGVEPVRPEKLEFPQSEKLEDMVDAETTAHTRIALTLHVDCNSDEAVLAAHEGWIALQEGRFPRPEIMNTLSASVGPASPVPGRYAAAPAANVNLETACANARIIPGTRERYACRSDTLFSISDAVPAFKWPTGPF